MSATINSKPLVVHVRSIGWHQSSSGYELYYTELDPTGKVLKHERISGPDGRGVAIEDFKLAAVRKVFDPGVY